VSLSSTGDVDGASVALCLICAILSPVVFSLCNLVDKVAVERRTWNTYAYTAVIGIFEMLIGAIECGASSWDNFNEENKLMIIWPLLGGLADACCVYLYFILLGLTDASIVVGCMYMYPVVVCLLSLFILDEQLGAGGYVGVVVLLGGVVILSINGIAKIVKKCRPHAEILAGMDELNEQPDEEEKVHNRENYHVTCWYPTPKRLKNCFCGCRDCDEVEEDEDDGVLGVTDAGKLKKHRSEEDDSFASFRAKRIRKQQEEEEAQCCCCKKNKNTEIGLSSMDTEMSEMSEPRSSIESRPSVDRALDDIGKDIGSDTDTSDGSINPPFAVVVPSHSPSSYRKRTQAASSRRAAVDRRFAEITSATEDSDASAPAHRHQKKMKKKLKKQEVSQDSFYVQEVHEKGEQQRKQPKRHPKFKKPAEVKKTTSPKESESDTNESESDDDADVDSGSDESSDDDEEEKEEKEEKEEEQEKEEGKEKEKEDEENGGNDEEKKKESGEGKTRSNGRKTTKSESKRKKVKKGVEVPNSRDDDKAAEGEGKKSTDDADPKRLEEGASKKPHKTTSKSYKKYVGKGNRSPRPFDLEDLSSTTDDVRSSMDERADSDYAARYKRRHRYNLPQQTSITNLETGESFTVVTREERSSKLKEKDKGTTSESDSVSRKSSKKSSHKNAPRNGAKGSLSNAGKDQVSSSGLSSESEKEIMKKEETEDEEENEKEKEKLVLGCIRPGVLFALLALPMVIATGGYEFLIALGAKKGMRTFQVSGVEISVQGLFLTLGAWLTKDGRKCFVHELTWNWLFAFLNAFLTICSQLLTVYSLTALPAAVSSSMCALQPLGILILETIIGVTKFRVSQCFAFKLPPIILIVAGVALLSLDVLMA